MNHNGKGKGPTKILYIEDGKNVQMVMTTSLSLLGYEVACADNGKLGIEKAKSWHPDLILTDFRMPVMDGPEAIRRLRAGPNTAHIPIFVLTSYTGPEARMICRKAGADRFFSKSLDMIETIDLAIQEMIKVDLK